MLPHKITDAYFIGQTLGFGAGVVLSVLLLDLLRRAATRQPGARAKYWQAAFALMWNLGGLLGELGNLAGTSTNTPWMLAVGVLNFSGAAFFPVGFLMLWQRPRDENTWHAWACRWLCRATMVSAGALTLLFLNHCIGHAQTPENHIGHLHGRLLAYHVAAATLAGTFLLWRGRLNNFAARFYAATTLFGVLTPAAITLLASVFGRQEHQGNWALIAEQQAPLLILLGAVVYFGDFRFSNVYVKTSLRFLAALLLALIFCLFVIYCLPPLVRQFTAFTLAGVMLGATALLTALLCGFAWLAPRLNRLVAGWLFREPDYARATQLVWQELSRQEEIEQIFMLSARLAEETLGLEAAHIVPLKALPIEQLAAALNSGEVCELNSTDPLRRSLGAEVEFMAPIRLSGQPTHALAITPGAQRRILLDSELSFLRALAGQVSSRLDALAAESERVAQQNKEERLRRQLTEAELRALRTQINPHFLFNSLNTIADLIVVTPATAERMTVQLAKIFRHVLRSSDRQMISVGEDLEFLKTWLDIEAGRFGERLRVRFETDETLTAESVPPLILQPLVENALKHGLAPKLGGGVLQVRVALSGNQLSLTVEDDGLGFPASFTANAINGAILQPTTNGIGLRNVAERLATIYAGRAQMNCETVATGGSRVTLLLPREE